MSGVSRTELTTDQYKKLCCHREAARCSCLSAVSFNSTRPRAQSFTISYCGFIFANAGN